MELRMEMTATLGKNPIRKVVTLMQDMQKEIEAEGKKEAELFEKFMCFCSSSGGDLTKAAEDAKASIEELSSKLKSEEAEKSQTEQELKDHKSDREQAKKDLGEATSLRTKEKAEYDASSAEAKTNIEAMGSAITTLEKAGGGPSYSFQSPAKSRNSLIGLPPSMTGTEKALSLLSSRKILTRSQRQVKSLG
jgi:hypothetical protein